jgi:hypothetical protein
MRNIYPKPDKKTLMKSSTVILILGIIIVSVGLAWILSGGQAGPATIKTVPPTPAPTTEPAVPVITVPPTAAATVMQTTETVRKATAAATVLPTTETTRVTTAAVPVSGDDIRNHFLDIAYNPTNRLERLNYSADQPRVTLSAVSAGNDDLVIIEKAAKEFNGASPTVKLSENIKQTESGDILIKFLTEEGLRAINLDTAPDSGPFTEVLTRGELYQGTTLAAKVLRGTIYINADLKGGARNHMLVRSLMYEMGLTGDTLKYPDSIFSATENTNVDIALVDKKAIAMLYAQGFANGMTMEDLKKVIYIP